MSELQDFHTPSLTTKVNDEMIPVRFQTTPPSLQSQE